MGIFGAQLDDDAIPQAKLSPDVQAKLPTWETKTENFAITTADNGKGYINTGATGPVKGTCAVGLPDGFEVSFLRVTAQDFWFQPAPGEECYRTDLGTLTGWGTNLAVSINALVNRITWKLVVDGANRMWVPLVGTVNLKAQYPLQGLDLKDKTPDGAAFNVNPPTCAAGRWEIRIRAEPSATLLGSLEWDGGFTWTDGAVAGVSDLLYLEIDASLTHAGDDVVWSDDPADDQFLTLSYSTGGGFLTLSTIKPYEGPLTIGRGQLLDYWIGQDGRLYARNGGATPFPYEAV